MYSNEQEPRLEEIVIFAENPAPSIFDAENLKPMKIISKNNFYLSPQLYGRKLTIKVSNQRFSYSHDDVVDANKERFSKGGSAYKSWSVYGFYSQTKGYPIWASALITRK